MDWEVIYIENELLRVNSGEIEMTKNLDKQPCDSSNHVRTAPLFFIKIKLTSSVTNGDIRQGIKVKFLLLISVFKKM